MASAGYSLVGFMDQEAAIAHLAYACIPPNPAPEALEIEWNDAKAKIGAPMGAPGRPDIQPIPSEYDDYLAELLAGPVGQNFEPQLTRDSFRLVEIDPLLAFQFTVDSVRSDHHCKSLNTSDISDLLTVALPIHPLNDQYHVQMLPQSVIIKSRSMNLRMLSQGINANVAGIQFGFSVALVHVVRHNDRCYLHNGFHRAFGARLAGATHIPCVFRDVSSYAEAGIRTDGGTFSAKLLESENPPTVGHFVHSRAHPVTLRASTRILHVSWAEYSLYDE